MKEETKIWLEKAALIILLIVLLSLVILFAVHKQYITDQGLVISFFGFLATFVVIGNYVQTDRIRQQTEKDINKITDKNDTTSIASQLNKMKQELYKGEVPKVDTINKDLEQKVSQLVAEKVAIMDQQYTGLVKSTFNYLAASNHADLIETTLGKNQPFECKVTTSVSRNKRNATARREGPNIEFRDGKGKIISQVDTVNGIPYNHIAVNSIVNLWDKINISILDKRTMEFLNGENSISERGEKISELTQYINIAKAQLERQNGDGLKETDNDNPK